MMIDEAAREARLPKWARDELAVLRREAASARADANAARAAHPPHARQSVWYRHLLNDPIPLPVHDLDRVTFTSRGGDPSHGVDRETLDIRREESGALSVLAPHGSISIKPLSANHIEIRAVR